MAALARHLTGLHGYALLQELGALEIFRDCPPDGTGLYRVLRAMEVEGYLESRWDVEGAGPARRVYLLTEPGWTCLRQWSATLRTYATTLENTLHYIEDSLSSGIDSTVDATTSNCKI